MLVLGIETSCDETGVALYSTATGLLGHILHSQIELHEAYGGVVPELASRDHIAQLAPLTRKLFLDTHTAIGEVEAIAYTAGPGLAGALLVGASFAEALAISLNIPAIAIHHLEAHLLSPLLSKEPPQFPFIALLVSGGHTQLMHVKNVGEYELLGETLDDAAGEAFDKTAQLLGLGYPGGSVLSRLAIQGKAHYFKLPRPMIASGDLNFSFSGLKTAVLTTVRKTILDEQAKANLAYEFQCAMVDVLREKSIQALKASGLTQLVVAGGVSANIQLRTALNKAVAALGAQVFYPELEFCTDNGAMIALAGALRLDSGMACVKEKSPHSGAFSIYPRWKLQDLT